MTSARENLPAAAARRRAKAVASAAAATSGETRARAYAAASVARSSVNTPSPVNSARPSSLVNAANGLDVFTQDRSRPRSRDRLIRIERFDGQLPRRERRGSVAVDLF